MSESIIVHAEKSEGKLEASLLGKLIELLKGVTYEVHRVARSTDPLADAYLEARRRGERVLLALETKASGTPGAIYEVIGKAAIARKENPNLQWVFGAPFVSMRGAQLCEKGGISFIDECGNLDIRFGTTVLSARTAKEHPEERKAQRSLFSPKTSRVSLALLLAPKREWTQQELAGDTGISLGLVNRTLHELLRRRYVEGTRGEWRLLDGDGLLEAWSREYRSRPPEKKIFMSRSTPSELEAKLDSGASEGAYRYALAEESAAKYRAPFAPSTRLVFYCDRIGKVVKHLGLRPVDVGGNVVILVPPDEGVFYGIRRVRVAEGDKTLEERRNLTNDIYTYLDLVANPARGKEQAEHLLEVISSEPERRQLSTDELARFQDFLKARDQAEAARRSRQWGEALRLLDDGISRVADISEESVNENVKTSRFHLWRALVEVLMERWKGDARERGRLLKRMREEIPPDQEVLDSYPAFRMNHALVRFILGCRHALEAVVSGSPELETKARIAIDHFKIATSPYTEGSGELIGDVERVREWLRKVGDLDLAF